MHSRFLKKILLCVALAAGNFRALSQSIDPEAPINTAHPEAERIITPVNQVLTPAGIQVELPGLRPQAIALSPDGTVLATSGKNHELYLIDPSSGRVLDKIPLPSESAQSESNEAPSARILEPDKSGQLSFTGLIFSPDGQKIFLSNVNGSIKVFVRNDQGKFAGRFSFPLPSSPVSYRKEEIPSGLAISPDGKKLYVTLNLSNRLLEMNAETGEALRFLDVGAVPFDVVLAGDKAYVSNWGGRRPEPGVPTGPAGHGMLVRVDPIRHVASEGSVTIIDLKNWKVIKEIVLGLHSSALAVTPDKKYIAIPNAGSDTVSILDTKKDTVVETLSLRWQAGDPFGASPNALTFDSNGGHLYVCNGTQNAVAVVRFRSGGSRIEGLIPTGWYPGAIVFDASRKMLHVANIKGFGSGKRLKPGEKVEFNSHQYFGSLSLIKLPDSKTLKEQTGRCLENFRRSIVKDAFLPPRRNQPARPVPERVGEPSVFKHVVYLIKENRTYDQVLGDLKDGRGSKDLCIFGENVTPNQHKMVRDFVLLDNTYCSGILSADGHNWATTAFVTDYLERSFAGFPRSYPDGMEDKDVDALSYSPAGFIWDNAIAHNVSVRSYGEFTIGSAKWKDKRKGSPRFIDIYKDFIENKGLIELSCHPSVASLNDHMMKDTIGWSMETPDILRAARFIKELKEFEEKGKFPNLSIICLPQDHTSGTKAGMPTPAAHVADNDLAFGQIVEAISKSKFWKETCIFAIEDDPQAGWDHISGYRTTAYVISPYTKRGAVVHNNYNQTGLIKTIELMLGLPPMNQMDASASPMNACFTDKPDFTPFTAVKNNIPLDQLNPAPKAINDPVQRQFAIMSATLPLEKADACPEDLLNRILWNAQKGSHVNYPAWALTHITGKDDDGD